MNESNIFATIKYEGSLVSDGFLDAKKSGEALIGIDEALKFFLYQENSEFQKMELEIPVMVRKGSWETIFPENIDDIILKTSAAFIASKYLGSALGQMAKNDFKDIGFKDVFKKSFKSMTWVIKMAIHLGTITKKKFENIMFSDDNSEVKLINDKGEILWVPTEYLEVFSNCPNRLFKNLAKIVEEERDLIIKYADNDKTEFAKITHNEKFIFTPTEEEEEILFPELEQGQYVELEGHITRGNENSNTIGFFYKNHVLTCFPETGNITTYKKHMFTNCILKGYVERIDIKGEFKEKRPRIKFIEVLSKNAGEDQQQLF